MGKRKSTYNQYEKEENPFQHMPPTTRWRRMNELRRWHQTETDQSTADGVSNRSQMSHTEFVSESEQTWEKLDGGPTMDELVSPAGSEEEGADCDDPVTLSGYEVSNELQGRTTAGSTTGGTDDGRDTDALNGDCFEVTGDLLEGSMMPSYWTEGETRFVAGESLAGECTSENCDQDPQEEDEEWYECLEYLNSGPSNTQDNEPLYKGSPISLSESMTLILLFILKHNLSGACLEDLLVLLSLHCAKPNLCKTSRYLFQKYFAYLKSDIVFHKFCSVCQALLTPTCLSSNTCSHCKLELRDDNMEYFIEIPIEDQLQTLFQREGFVQDIQHRFTRKKRSKDNVEDIYDGTEYLKFMEPGGLLLDKYNLSFFWYTDGIPLFKSSKSSLWPLYFMINELPYHKRVSKDHMIFAGLWFGASKPCMSTFLKPFHARLTKIHKGISVTLPTKDKVTIRGVVLGGTCDLPAKAIMLNMAQFNGKFGCARCKQEGKVIRTGNGHTRVYPFCKENPAGPKRSHLETLRHAETAFHSKQDCHGIKGPSWLYYLGGDVIHGTGVDYMHQVLLGLVRKLLKLWFASSFSSELFSLSRYTGLIDKRLADVKPPNFVTRLPRSISEHMKFWKASECRSWLFYYSVPLLMDVMEEEYLNHYLLLVEAIYLLNGTSLSLKTVDYCEYLLHKYVCLFSVLYAEAHMSANLHLLVHLPDAVRNLGPLWVQSCFHFEGINGQLLHFFNGTQKPELQITSTIGSMLMLPSLVSKLKSDSAVAFYQKHLGQKPLALKREFVWDNVWLVGAPTGKLPGDGSIDWACFPPGECESSLLYCRLQVGSTLYQSRSYKLVKKRNSFSVAYKSPDVDGSMKFGQIEYFVKVTSPKISCFAVIRKFEEKPSSLASNRVFHLVRPSRNGVTLEAIPIGNLLEMCVFVPSTTDPTEAFFIMPPNIHEKD